MSEPSSHKNSSPRSWNSDGSSLAANNASPPPESNSSPPSVLPPAHSESSPPSSAPPTVPKVPPPSSAPPTVPKVPPPSSSTPSVPAPTSIGSNSPPPNQSTPAPPPKIAASPPPPSSSAPPPSSPLHGPTSPPSESSPLPNLPPDSKATPPPQVVIPPVPKTPQGSPPSSPLPRGPPSPSTPDTSPPTEIMSPKSSPSTPLDAKQVNNAAHRAPPSSPTTSSSRSSPSVISSGTGTAIGISAALLVVALVAILFVILRKRKKRGIRGFVGQYKPTLDGYYHTPADAGGHAAHRNIYHASNSPSSPATGKSYGTYMGHGYHAGPQEPAGSRSWFTYEELTDVTNGFSHKNIIGEGGFGCVYKGNLPDGRQVAVKQLKVGSGQGEREFRAEVEIISRIHHRHLVSLVGYCISEHQRLLVYEFIPNKTLEYHLHEKRLPVLDWSKRMKIAIGSARGLAYLHEDCHPRIIHRDIKSANILVDDSFEAKVADFGLAKLSNDANTHVSTRVMGTFGYMAPEYATSGKLTDRSDVFSFGVVLLELITGRKPIDASQPLGDESLVEWARPLLIHVLETGDYEELVDPRLENNYARSEMLKMIEAAAACVRHSATKRPRMVQVLRALDSEGNLVDLSNGVKFGQSTVYDSGQYSTDIEKFRKMAFGSDIYDS